MSYKRKEKVVFNQREFLNIPGEHSSANIVTNISKNMSCEDDNPYEVNGLDITCAISDCSRTVNLSFDIYYNRVDKEMRKKLYNAVHKAKTLAKVTAAFAEAVEKETKLFLESIIRQEEAEKLKKEKEKS